MSDALSHATVTVTPRPLWRIRLARELPRYLLQGLAVAGLLASARFAIAPPRPVIARSSTPSSALVDRAAEGFAALFARRYLTWDSRDPEAHRLALAPFVGPSMEAEAGMQPPESGEQRVQWTQVVQTREPTPGEHVYTVAVQTDSGGLLYLTVSVVRVAGGGLALAGYPAFVGAPASTVAASPGRLREVEDPALTTVVTRALRNYLARAESELAADLAAGARVALPGTMFALGSVDSLDWSAGGRSVVAVVHARDERGVQYTLGYELDVVSAAGRWEVSAIQMNPNT
ncbi:MAG TPA: conjugal transfer protein [Solirubrobacteraceae bacterium]|nr:conjugal transfer protein [Solirubrobacteraceae bacterium]